MLSSNSHLPLSIFLFILLRYASSYNVYNYDYTTPIFTPDGLLKQVQYASSAPTHCTPIVIVPIIIHRSEDENGHMSSECLIIMATLSPSKSTSSNTNDETKIDDGISNVTNNNNNRGQSRIIQIPISSPPTSTTQNERNNVSSSTDCGKSLLIGVNGLLPDCISLLRYARDQLHSYHKTYGVHRLHTSRDGIRGSGGGMSDSATLFSSASSCASRFAKSVGDKCQEHSFGGGLRPFGSQIVICGVDRDMMNIFITDPSGAVARHSYDRRSRLDGDHGNEQNRQSLQDVIVLGGDEKFQDRIRQDIVRCCGGLDSRHEVKDIIQAIGNALKESPDKISSGLDMDASTSTDSEPKEHGIDMVILGSRNCQNIQHAQLKRLMEESISGSNILR
jgi:20S proteasome alpha/beta subunit